MPPDLPLPVLLLLALHGRAIARLIGDAARLGFAEHLAAGPRSVGELAAATATNADALYRVLRALSALGIFRETEPRVFANTAASEYLRPATPGTIHAFLIWLNTATFWDTLRDFDHTLRTGQSAFTQAHGVPPFDYLTAHPQPARLFDDAMSHDSATMGPLIAAAYDFADCGEIVDIGGGHGALLKAILTRFPGPRGRVLDRPAVVADAESGALGERLSFVSGDFFTDAPGRADLYVLKHVLHDWDDAQCIGLLARCRQAMPRQGRVLIVEQLIGEDPGSVFAKFSDIEMLALYGGGRERTADEFAALLAAAGLRLARIVPVAHSRLSLIEAVAADEAGGS